MLIYSCFNSSEIVVDLTIDDVSLFNQCCSLFPSVGFTTDVLSDEIQSRSGSVRGSGAAPKVFTRYWETYM